MSSPVEIKKPLRVFSPEVIDETRSLVLTPDVFKGRKKVRGVTIDGSTAQELDDALWVERQGSGYKVVISIADAASIVPKDSLTDQEALNRGFTQYLGPIATYPMLPASLSNRSLSLQPERLRPTISYEIDLNDRLAVENVEVGLTKLASERRFTYAGVDQMLEYGAPNSYRTMLIDAQTVADGLFTQRRQRGALVYFDRSLGITTSEEGAVRTIKDSEAKNSNLIIQEFMILANEVMAKYLIESGYPALFRNHTSKEIDFVIEGFSLAPGQNVTASVKEYNRKLFSSLNPASYSPDNQGHFGLRSKGYMHSTSPIRRYADIVNQRAIHGIISGDEPQYTRDELIETSSKLNTIWTKNKKATEDSFTQWTREIVAKVVKTGNVERIGRLDKGEFRYFLQEMAQEERLTPAIAEAIKQRIGLGEINAHHSILILESMSDDGGLATEVQQTLLGYLRSNPDLAQSLISWTSNVYGWPIPKYDSQILKYGADGLVESWVSTAKMEIDDEVKTSDPSIGVNRAEAQHNARVSLLTNVFDIEDSEREKYKVDIEAIYKEKEEEQKAIAKKRAERMAVPNVIREGLEATKALGRSQLNGTCQKLNLNYDIQVIDESPLGNIKVFTARTVISLPDGESMIVEGKGSDKRGAMNSAALKANQLLLQRNER